jgi:hypothetical protein
MSDVYCVLNKVLASFIYVQCTLYYEFIMPGFFQVIGFLTYSLKVYQLPMTLFLGCLFNGKFYVLLLNLIS